MAIGEIMTLEEKAKEYYDKQYHTPINEQELVEFARLMLDEFIVKIEANMVGTVCNGPLRSVLFEDRSHDGAKGLNQIKEEFLDVRSNENDKAIEVGERPAGDTVQDTTTRGYNKLIKDKESEVQRKE